MFESYMAKLSSRAKIEKATKTSNLTDISDDEMAAFLKTIETTKKNIKAIKKYI